MTSSNLSNEKQGNIDISYYQDTRKTAQHKTWTKVVFAKPREVGHFSLNNKREFCLDNSQLKTLKTLPTTGINFDLSDGYKDRFVKRDDNIREGLDSMLKWIQQKRELDKEFKIPEFVMWRGHLTKIMCTPYESRDGWKMAVEKRGNTLYLSEIELEESREKRLQATDKEKLMMYWGVRFEGYATEPTCEDCEEPKQKYAKQETITNTNEAYCTVLSGKVNNHSVLFSGEVDCKDKSSKSPTDNYIELKTSRVLTVKKHHDNFHKYKTGKWWAQSYLAGIPTIICGFRNDEGFVKEIKNFNTLSLPNLARNIPFSWNPNVCLDLLEYFLTNVKEICREENKIWSFTWKPGQSEILYHEEKLPEGVYVIPPWYLEMQ